MTKKQWSISALSVELGIDRRTLAKRLTHVRPAGIGPTGAPLYWLEDAMAAAEPTRRSEPESAGASFEAFKARFKRARSSEKRDRLFMEVVDDGMIDTALGLLDWVTAPFARALHAECGLDAKGITAAQTALQLLAWHYLEERFKRDGLPVTELGRLAASEGLDAVTARFQAILGERTEIEAGNPTPTSAASRPSPGT